MAQVFKEFTNNAVRKTVRLEVGFDCGALAYHSVTTVTTPQDPAEMKHYDSAVYGPSTNGYGNAHEEFKRRVLALI